MEEQMKPRIDVIIPVYKPDRSFAKMISRLMHQTISLNHIYLLQTVEEGQNRLIRSEDPRITVHSIQKEEFDHGATRFHGAMLAKGEMEPEDDPKNSYLLFMTQDAMPANEHLLEKLLEPFDDPLTGITYARQLVKKSGDELDYLTRLHNYPEHDIVKTKKDREKMGIKTYFCSDVCAMYRQDLFWQQGGFMFPTLFNEDMIMAYKMISAGYQVVYCSQAKVYHSHSYTCMQQFHRNFDLGASQRQYHYIFDRISSEKEGAGYAGTILKKLVKQGKIVKAFYFAVQCFFKLAGFELGKHYDRLPLWLVKKCTTNPSYKGWSTKGEKGHGLY